MVPRTTPETLKGLKSAAVGWLKPAIFTAGQHRLSRETGEIAQSSAAECKSIMQKVLGSILGVGVEKFLEAHSYPLYELTGVWASKIPLWPLFPNEFFLVPDTEGLRAQLLPQQGLLAYLPHPLCHPPLEQDLAFSQFIFSSNNFPCHIKRVTLTITYFLILFPSLLSNLLHSWGQTPSLSPFTSYFLAARVLWTRKENDKSCFLVFVDTDVFLAEGTDLSHCVYKSVIAQRAFILNPRFFLLLVANTRTWRI